MRGILIVGAGQAGLHLALGLLRNGYEVTLVSNRTPDDIRDGRVMSGQAMFATALGHERALGLDLWAGDCPPIEGMQVAVAGPGGEPVIRWDARLDTPARSVDQRLKMPAWMAEVERLGGKIVIHDATVDDLESYAAQYDLVLVAAGKGQLASLFETDPERSPYRVPQRALALTYVNGLTPRPGHSAVCFNIIPGVGEYFVFPALTHTGPCEIMVFEGLPGGPMDCWSDVRTPAEHLARGRSILETFLPWEAERCDGVELTDENGVLAGRFTPVVRRPVATLPSGAPVLGVADVVVLNDPITGQGSNNAAKCAASYLAAILEHGERPFDAAWMERTFARYWENARHVTAWTNALLAPPPPHVLRILDAAGRFPEVASRFVNGFDDPADFTGWFTDPAAAEEYLTRIGG
ncbi:putative intracellular protease/amidase [Streptosporangium becharense]|uniref:2-polyprenyl-6-methoxyphenol hydroxylase-like FAD-dependent oxidoreductase n=1 Tax=Streptosporangium becharense TaxID=1816182 RepID=A0A7W9MJL4_9ACTN|nr:styrene monooxygenase/indole monooxygenase family protein [Streptosporangium becharense]MBB2910452.1 putative intracellular protease/amidase [Streptosporangium becharense]MBB5823195.1 2-polyprenyl-6-methoxyphenol hydroxylase-like FAD-dependent oxidoreductase [Streptosporangium becharense]